MSKQSELRANVRATLVSSFKKMDKERLDGFDPEKVAHVIDHCFGADNYIKDKVSGGVHGLSIKPVQMAMMIEANPHKSLNGDTIASFILMFNDEEKKLFHAVQPIFERISGLLAHMDKDRATLEALGVY